MFSTSGAREKWIRYIFPDRIHLYSRIANNPMLATSDECFMKAPK